MYRIGLYGTARRSAGGLWAIISKERGGVKRPKMAAKLWRWIWPLLWAAAAVAEPRGRAESLVDLMAEAAFERVVEQFAPEMRLRGGGAAQWQAAWNVLEKKLGRYERRLESRVRRQDQYEIVRVTCQFAGGRYDVRVVYDRSMRVNGLFFVPAPPPAPYSPPAYTQTADWRQEEVSVGQRPWVLPGTLTLPASLADSLRVPAVLLLHGSGPHDRDGSVGPNKPLRDLAWGLASRGIASLRYDKRTRRYAGRLDRARLTPEEEVLQDAAAALDLLRRERRVRSGRIFALGHSLGGTLLPRLAARDSALSGLVLMAAAARPLEDLIVEQVAYVASLDGEVDADELRRLEGLRARAARIKDPGLEASGPPAALLMGLGPRYWLYLRAYDPVRTAADLDTPMMLLQGERDYQVTEADWLAWRAGLASRRGVRFGRYPGLNHLFMEGEGPSRPEEYRRPGHVDEAVLDDIAAWIVGVSRAADGAATSGQ